MKASGGFSGLLVMIPLPSEIASLCWPMSVGVSALLVCAFLCVRVCMSMWTYMYIFVFVVSE